MSITTAALPTLKEKIRVGARLRAYQELSKPRIVNMVLVTAFLGYFLGGQGIESWGILGALLAGIALAAAGAGALNQALEREADGRMDRTRNRPLPRGDIAVWEAYAFGVFTVAAGTLLLAWQVNILSAALALASALLYVLVYTPLKRWSWVNTTVGAIPGALPPMAGWAAATGHLEIGGWVLFAILFLWQHPHFYAIAWMCRDDYRRAGFRMLPVVAPDGRSTFAQVLLFSVVLIPVSVLPVWTSGAGVAYAVGALFLGLYMLRAGAVLWRTHTVQDARRVLRASVLYLPLLLGLIVLDTWV